MGAVWLRARAQLRGRLLASMALALLVGLAGGVVLAAVAGARRSDAALPRFMAATRTTEATVWILGPRGGQPARSDLAAELRAVAALPQVRTAQRGVGLIISASDPTGTAGPMRQLAWVGVDRAGSELFVRPRLVAGRLPRADRAEEAVVDEEFAWRHRLRTGASLRVGTYTRAQFGPAGEGVPIPPEGPAVDLRVTGILRSPEDLLPVIEGREEVDADESSQLYLTPAFWRRYGPDLANYGMPIAVDLHRDAADLPGFTAAVKQRFAGSVHIQAGEFGEEGATAGIRRAIAVETGALAAFAVLAALALLLLAGQTLDRQVLLESAEYPALRALGMTRAQLIGVALVRGAAIGVTGAAVAIAVALALSPLTPIGVARRAELHPGVAADWPVLAAGSVAIVGMVAACAVLAAWRAARAPGDATGQLERAGAGRPSPAATALAAAGGRPSAVTGMRFALEPGRGRTAVPVRPALAGAVAAVCTLAAAAGFGASLVHLGRNPAGYGVTWDVTVGGVASAAAAEPLVGRLVANPSVAAVAGEFGLIDAAIDGRYVPLTATEELKGRLPPALIEGREPLRPDEIALGSITLRHLRRQVGDTVTLTAAQGPARRLQVVGRVVLNRATFVDSVMTPGKGGIVHPDLIRRLNPPSVEPYASAFRVRLDPSTDRDQVVAQLRREFGTFVLTPKPHGDVRNLQRVANLPGLLAGLVALLALGTVTHTLVTSVRRRRRDLAVLKALGFTRGQVAATICWQATTFAVVALAVGLPLGVAAGRWAWQLTADTLGVHSSPVVPLAAMAAAAAGTVLAANLVAAVPGRAASRLRPAVALRSE
jgi:ABC-type lipoprotein release transport system permease subunit